MFTWENTWKEIEDSDTTIAVVPIGSTEQHGTNLPLASDSIITARVAEALADSLNAYLTPIIPIGTSPEHMSFRGTLTLTDDTLKAVLTDIIHSLTKSGFKTIIVVSLHGGNYVLWSYFISQLGKQFPNASLLVADLQHAWDEAYKGAGFTTPSMHADECEASLIASLRSDLVGPHAIDFPNPKDQLKGARLDPVGFPLDVREVSPWGALGEPSKGSREKGDLFWEVFLRIAVQDVRRQAGL
ncbi:MAG: creatininase family protein [Chloroflexi bacterium]|nr:creatininase family protein [Chloroflexota bacterium]